MITIEMEMPKKCEECPFCDRFCTAMLFLNPHEIPNKEYEFAPDATNPRDKKRPDRCPLIEVKQE